jgi:uncharacterized protein YecT (DUF1311 family)
MSEAFKELDRERVRIAARVVATAHQPDPEVGGGAPDLKQQWRQSEKSFVAYRQRTCDAVLTASLEGSWRDIETLSCQLRLTRERISLLRDAQEGKGV